MLTPIHCPSCDTLLCKTTVLHATAFCPTCKQWTNRPVKAKLSKPARSKRPWRTNPKEEVIRAANSLITYYLKGD